MRKTSSAVVPSDVIQRGVEGLQQCRSNELITMTLAVLRASIRVEGDLATLVPVPKIVKRQPEAATEVVAAFA